jgi:hypothetical protein
VKYGSFPWHPLEAALPVSNVTFLTQKQFFEEELIKPKETATNAAF